MILLGTFLKGKKGSWLLGSIGLIILIYTAVTVIRIYFRTADLEVPLQGILYIPPPEGEAQGIGADIATGFQVGYYLSYVAGLACILLALLRKTITGESNAAAG